MLLDGYHGDILNNFEGAAPKFNPRNPNRTNSSPLLDASDPIQMHLLVSTALEDATGYAILAPEEVDSLRKQCIRLTQRIESTRQNLAVQAKYRDAAINMGKLYSDGEGKRRSRGSLGLKRSSGHAEQSREAEAERAASERRCEDLAQELWGLEKRLIEPQTALLQHTAGILQMTHKPSAKKKAARASQEGMPGSPESMYTYSNARGSVAPGEDIFDERSLYRSFDRLDILGGDGQASKSVDANGIGADAEAKLKELWEMMHPSAKDGEDDAPVQAFSLLAFSSKVQSLHSQTAMLNDQKEVLQRQIKQQRELNNKSDETKDREMSEMETQLKSTQANLSQVEAQAQSLGSQLAAALDQSTRSQGEATAALHENIENLQNELEDLKSSNAIELADLQSQLTSSSEHISALQQAKATAEAHILDLTTDLEKARKAQEQVVADLEEARQAQQAQSARAVDEEELDAKNMEIARLQTEVTIARAELDGAYGSRAQRAAEVAANPAVQKELDALRRELGETIEEYEVLTKASIEGERERELLEKEIDRLRDEREGLEAKLSDERVRWMGVKSPGPDGASGQAGVGAGNTSTAVLKNEFKKMMRDTRAENAKALRVSCSVFVWVGKLLTMV